MRDAIVDDQWVSDDPVVTSSEWKSIIETQIQSNGEIIWCQVYCKGCNESINQELCILHTTTFIIGELCHGVFLHTPHKGLQNKR